MPLFKNDTSTRILLDKRPTGRSRYACEAKGSVLANGRACDWVDVEEVDLVLPMIKTAIDDKILVPWDGEVLKKAAAADDKKKMDLEAKAKEEADAKMAADAEAKAKADAEGKKQAEAAKERKEIQEAAAKEKAANADKKQNNKKK